MATYSCHLLFVLTYTCFCSVDPRCSIGLPPLTGILAVLVNQRFKGVDLLTIYNKTKFLCALRFQIQLGLPALIKSTSLFPFKVLLSGIFHFYSNSNRTFGKQTVEKLVLSTKTA